MTPEPEEGFTVEWTPSVGSRRRLRFEPRSDGTWWRISDHWTGCSWYEEGREPADDIVVDTGEVTLP